MAVPEIPSLSIMDRASRPVCVHEMTLGSLPMLRSPILMFTRWPSSSFLEVEFVRELRKNQSRVDKKKKEGTGLRATYLLHQELEHGHLREHSRDGVVLSHCQSVQPRLELLEGIQERPIRCYGHQWIGLGEICAHE